MGKIEAQGMLVAFADQFGLSVGGIAKAKLPGLPVEISAEESSEPPPGDDIAIAVLLKVKALGFLLLVGRQEGPQALHSRCGKVEPSAPDMNVVALEGECRRRGIPRG